MRKPLFPVICLHSLPLIMAMAYGFQHLAGGGAIYPYYRIWSIPTFLVIAGLSFHALRRNHEAEYPPPPAWLGIFLSALSLGLTCYFYLSAVASTAVWLSLALFPALLAALAARRNNGLPVIVLAVAGLVVNLYLIATVPHDHGANMLEIIEAASVELLAGKDPYHIYWNLSSTPNFQYLPALWLPYLPLVRLDLDPRILNVAALLGMVWVFERALGLDREKKTAILGSTLYPFLLSPPLSLMLVHGHLWPYWLYLLAAMALLQRNHYLLTALLFGITLAARQPALWLLPPLAAYLLARKDWPKTTGYILISLLVYSAVVLPFAMATGSGFWNLTYLAISGHQTIQPHLSAEEWLAPIGLEGLMRPLQGIVVAAAAILVYRRRARFPAFLMIAGSAYLWAVFLNNYAVRYVYFPGLFLFAAGLSVQLSPRPIEGRIDTKPGGKPILAQQPFIDG